MVQSPFWLESFKLSFALIIASIKSSILSVFSTSISTAYCETKFVKASSKVFPIATLFPDAAITLFKVGTESYSFMYC